MGADTDEQDEAHRRVAAGDESEHLGEPPSRSWFGRARNACDWHADAAKADHRFRYVVTRRPLEGALGVMDDQIPVRPGQPAWKVRAYLTNIPAPGEADAALALNLTALLRRAAVGDGNVPASWDNDRGVLETLERLPAAVMRVWPRTDGAGYQECLIHLTNDPASRPGHGSPPSRHRPERASHIRSKHRLTTRPNSCVRDPTARPSVIRWDTTGAPCGRVNS